MPDLELYYNNNKHERQQRVEGNILTYVTNAQLPVDKICNCICHLMLNICYNEKKRKLFHNWECYLIDCASNK